MVKFGLKLAELETFPGGWWVGVGVAGSSENKANLAQLELELGLSLAKNVNLPMLFVFSDTLISSNIRS